VRVKLHGLIAVCGSEAAMYPVLQKEDVLKVDIGVHVNGRICDSAFTLTFEPTYDNLLEAVRAATDTGIRVRVRPSHCAEVLMCAGSRH
jgi:methionine aminopeptidase